MVKELLNKMFGYKKQYKRMQAGKLLDCYLSKKDQAAFKELYERYQDKLRAFFSTLLPHKPRNQKI